MLIPRTLLVHWFPLLNSRFVQSILLKTQIYRNLYVLEFNLGEQRWRSGESTCLPPMWPGFDSRTRRHMWAEFVVGSRPCSEGFSPGTPVFLPPQKPTFPNSNSTWNARTSLNEFLELFGASRLSLAAFLKSNWSNIPCVLVSYELVTIIYRHGYTFLC